MFIWRRSYRTGLADLDREHIVILLLLNHLRKSLRGKASVEYLAFVMDALTEQLHAHFINENAAMSLARYPEMETHVGAHWAFLTRLRDIRNQPGPPTHVAERFFDYAADWTLTHMDRDDADFARFCAANRPA